MEDSEAVTENFAVSGLASESVPVPTDWAEGVLQWCEGMWLYTSRSAEWTRRSGSAVLGCMSVNADACGEIVRCRGLINASSGPGRIWSPLSNVMRMAAEIYWHVGTIGMALRRSCRGLVVGVA